MTQHTPGPWKTHTTIFPNGKKIKQRVRGICQFDVLNPCWNDRARDIPGQHWGGGKACPACTRAAIAKAEGR